MAGAGWHDFVAGEVLTAANVQDYLQDQAVMRFASSAARGSAIATPTEGMTTYLTDTNTAEIFDGSSWVTIADLDGGLPVANGGTGATNVTDAHNSLRVGAVPIAATSVANAGGSVITYPIGWVTFTGVTSISLNGVFSSSYRNYEIKFLPSGVTANATIAARLRASGTDATSGYLYMGQRIASTNTTGTWTNSTASDWSIGAVGASAAQKFRAMLSISNPTLAQPTNGFIQATYDDGSNWYSSVVGCATYGNGQYDGITFTINAGNMSGGVIVYAWND